MRKLHRYARYSRRFGSLRALWLGTVLAGLPVMAHAQTGVEDIVVTAQKREQNLQDVPISITAITADSIAANRIQNVGDLSAVAPNLTVRLAAGGGALPNFTLRGILTGGSAAGTDKGVALYLDGVYIQAVLGGIFDLADIERIEVLKGPQGTLFGRNATGGAISIITRDPSGEFNARQELTYGNYDQFRSKTSIDLPRIGPLSAAITYLHSQRHGDVRNLGAGKVWDYGPATGGQFDRYTSPSRLGDHNTEAVMATVKLDLIDDLKLTYKFDYSEDNSTPAAQGVAYLRPDTLLANIYAANAAAGAQLTPITNKRPGYVNNEFSLPTRFTAQGHNFTARYRLTDEISIKNILAYRKTSAFVPGFALDGLGGLRNLAVDIRPVLPSASPVPVLSPPGAVLTTPASLGTADTAAPFLFLGNNINQKERQWSNEFQVNVSTDAFDLTAGILYFNDKAVTPGIDNTLNTQILLGVIGQNTAGAGTPFVLPGNPGFQNTRIKVISKAIFVQPEFHLTSQIDVVGGIRMTRDRKRGIEFAPIPSALPAGTPISASIDYKGTEVSLLAGVNYRPTDDILLYGKYATGYISGGQLATIPYKPETAKSFEAGFKVDLFDRRLRTNLALFHVKYGNIQYTTSGSLTGVPEAALFSSAVISSADAKAYGLEWENTIIPVDGLTLTANLGYTHFKFDQSTLFPGFAFQSAPAPYLEFQRPKWTGNLAAQYETSEIMAGGHAIFRVDGNFRSRNLMTSDLTIGGGTTGIIDPAIVAVASTPFQWIVNARAGLMDMDIAGAKASVAFWGRNIFNNRRVTQYLGLDFTGAPSVAQPNGAQTGAVGSVIYEQARTYGVDVIFAF